MAITMIVPCTSTGQADKYAQFVAYAADGQAAGLVEAALRTNYVNGTSSTPLAFIEGMYVAPQFRRQGGGPWSPL
jgi:aminoglycoside 6'-N-acetyltransferase I